jgi:hypothetical protein
MRKAALYVQGRIVLADSHLEAYHQLTAGEQQERLVSGMFDTDTEEFDSELPEEHFFDKEMLLVRHGMAEEALEPDSDISEYGVQQVYQLAALLAQTFEPKKFTGITSPLLRCLRTSLILHELLDIDFQVRAEVMESPLFLKDDQQYRLQNHHDKFPQFHWGTSHIFV